MGEVCLKSRKTTIKRLKRTKSEVYGAENTKYLKLNDTTFGKLQK
tara:strand:- start:61 stop:195 length:135 start_codon:yes stop_codon:yes gene_type:complete